VEFYLLFTSSTPATKPPDSASPVSRSSTSAGIRRQGLRPRLLARWLSTLFNLDGVPGDKFLANGKIQPFFNVESRRYTKDLGASVIAVLELNGDLSMIVNKVSIREAMTLPPRNADSASPKLPFRNEQLPLRAPRPSPRRPLEGPGGRERRGARGLL